MKVFNLFASLYLNYDELNLFTTLLFFSDTFRIPIYLSYYTSNSDFSKLQLSVRIYPKI